MSRRAPHSASAFATALLAAAIGGAGQSARTDTAASGTLAPGTRWATRYYAREGETPGPTVLVVGGIHGNQPAGYRAADQIRHWTVTRGKLVVIPAANRPGLKENSRDVPGSEHADLNRSFPRAAQEAPRGKLAGAIWRFVRKCEPELLMDLHEGYDFHRSNPESHGSSAMSCLAPTTLQQAERAIEAVNSTITEDDRRFVTLREPVEGSLVRAAADWLGVRALTLLTTSGKQPLSLRTRQHRIMVHRLLSDLGMASGGVDVLLGEDRPPGEIRVAVYDGGGSLTSGGPAAFDRTLRAVPNLVVHRVGPPEIQSGALAQFDAVVFAGGSASKQAQALGDAGRAAVRRFVEDGGGYIGSCAGSYLATSQYSWSLRILDANVIDRKHWQRGKGDVKVRLTDEGRRILGGGQDPMNIRYANGPLLGPGGNDDLADFTPLALYETEIATGGAPHGVMKGTAAMVASTYGKGRVFCTSPHPEYTPGLEGLVQRAVRWAAAQ